MFVLVHVTDSVRPTDAFVTYPASPVGREDVAAAEGMAAPLGEARQGDVAEVRWADDIVRHRHRKARRLALAALSSPARAASH